METTIETQKTQERQVKNLPMFISDIKPIELVIDDFEISLGQDYIYFKGGAVEYFEPFSMDKNERATQKAMEIQTIIERMIKEVSEVASTSVS